MATKKSAVPEMEEPQAVDQSLETENASLKDQMKQMQELMLQMKQQMTEQQTLIQRMASGEKVRPPRQKTQAEKD